MLGRKGRFDEEIVSGSISRDDMTPLSSTVIALPHPCPLGEEGQSRVQRVARQSALRSMICQKVSIGSYLLPPAPLRHGEPTDEKGKKRIMRCHKRRSVGDERGQERETSKAAGYEKGSDTLLLTWLTS